MLSTRLVIYNDQKSLIVIEIWKQWEWFFYNGTGRDSLRMYSNEAKTRGAGGYAGRDASELQSLDLGAGSRRSLRSLTWLFRVASAAMRRAACNVHTEITAWSVAPPAPRCAAPPPRRQDVCLIAMHGTPITQQRKGKEFYSLNAARYYKPLI